MQKKLIAVAVAGLASTAVFAQSNVTIYGVADAGLVVKGSRTAAAPTNGQKFGIDSGLKNGSRLGFKGTDDLGGGLKSNFVIETGVDMTAGTGVGTGGNFMGRQTWVGLAGGFGEVRLGRQYSPMHLMADAIDPFNTGTAGQIVNLFQYAVRVNNAAVYISPKMSGFDVKVAYSKNATGDERLAVAKNTSTTWAINPMYANGPILVGFNYHQIDPGTGAAKAKNTSLGGTYDFGAAKVHALWNQNKNGATVIPNLTEATSTLNAGIASVKTNLWMLGVTAPVGANAKVQFSYNRLDDKGVQNLDAAQWAVGGVYNLSKRTNVYAAYAKISNKSNNGLKAAFTVGNAGNAGDGNQSALNVGMQHWF